MRRNIATILAMLMSVTLQFSIYEELDKIVKAAKENFAKGIIQFD